MVVCQIFCLLLVVVKVQGFNVLVSPLLHRIKPDTTTITVMCTAEVVLKGCQYTWRTSDNQEHPLLDLSRGASSQYNASLLPEGVSSYSYTGRGLVVGDCGISLVINGTKDWIIGCRLRSAKSAWIYGWMTLFAFGTNRVSSNPRTVPRELVDVPGKNVTLNFYPGEGVNNCYFRPNGISEFHLTQASKGRYRTTSTNPTAHCLLNIIDLSEEDNGPVYMSGMLTRQGYFEALYLPLIVAQAPRVMTLEVSKSESNTTLTCRALGGRPVANISWMLGEKVVRNDSVDEEVASVNGSWRWPWSENDVTQKCVLPPDAGEDMEPKCVVSHAALTRPVVVKRATPTNDNEIIERHSASSSLPPICVNHHPDANVPALSETSQPIPTMGTLAPLVTPPSDPLVSAPYRPSRPTLSDDITPPFVPPRPLSYDHAHSCHCPASEEERVLRLREAWAFASAAEFRAKAEEAKARQEEAWAKYAENALMNQRKCTERPQQSHSQP